jgi:hypothetical protein
MSARKVPPGVQLAYDDFEHGRLVGRSVLLPASPQGADDRATVSSGSASVPTAMRA